MLDQILRALRRPAAGIDIANRANDTTLFGLITFRCQLEIGDRDPGEAVLHVRFGAARAAIPAAQVADLQPTGQWRVRFNVNSHLIEDGRHKLEAELRWPDGTVAPLPIRAWRVENPGELAEAVRRDLQAFGTPAIFGRTVDSSLFPHIEGKARAWFEQAPAPDVPLSLEPSANAAAAHRHLLRWGFCILPERLPGGLIDEFWSSVEAAIAAGKLAHKPGSSDRIHNAHRLSAGRKIWLFPPVMDFLRRHFRDEPCACQTLTYPNGSEQQPHQDTIHLTPYPSGLMCGVWIALQDVVPDSGELVIYPGSHVVQRLRAGDLGLAKVDADYSSYAIFDKRIKALIREHGYEPRLYRPKAGEILVWHENLIHGGSRRANRDLSRKSIVSHYFPRGGIAYYDSRGEAAYLEPLG
jgi:hypothetical protein